MRRSNRLFEIIQILRSAGRPMTADALAQKLEVSTRTIYRDISALQMMSTPIEGEPGIGYVMRRGYDLPPLNFDLEEIEALRVGLALLSRTGDSALQRAARGAFMRRSRRSTDRRTGCWWRHGARRRMIRPRAACRSRRFAMRFAPNANCSSPIRTSGAAKPCEPCGRWRWSITLNA